MLGPGDGTVERRKVLDGFGDKNSIGRQPDAPLERDLRAWHDASSRQFTAVHGYVVRDDRSLAMYADTGLCLFLGRRAEQVEAEVMAHDAREQPALGIVAIFGIRGGAVGRELDRPPWRNPERIHAGGFVQNLGDVPPLDGDRQTDAIVFELHRAAVVKLDLSHPRGLDQALVYFLLSSDFM